MENTRKEVNTINAIESRISVIRKSIKNRKPFATGDSVKMVIDLANWDTIHTMSHADLQQEPRIESTYDQV